MSSTYTGQLILGTDKRNPLFTVYSQEEDDQEQLHVYYGLELLEIVSTEPNAPSFKMLVGRLYNAENPASVHRTRREEELACNLEIARKDRFRPIASYRR